MVSSALMHRVSTLPQRESQVPDGETQESVSSSPEARFECVSEGGLVDQRHAVSLTREVSLGG